MPRRKIEDVVEGCEAPSELPQKLRSADAIDDVQAAVVPPFNPSEKLLNGRRAEALLKDPLLNAVFDSIAAKYRAAFENAPRGDVETLRIAHASLAALKDVVGAIRAHLGSAKMYEADLARVRSAQNKNY